MGDEAPSSLVPQAPSEADEFLAGLESAGVPQEVRDAVAGLEPSPTARNAILRHKDAREVAAVVALFRLDHRSGKAKYTWDELAVGLNHDFPGLATTGAKLRSFCETHLDYMLVMPAGYARKALLDAKGELNAAVSLLDLREKALKAIDDLKDKVGKTREVQGKDGRTHVVPDGPGLGEYAKALKAAGDLTKMFAEEEEKWGFTPQSKRAPAVEFNLNLQVGGRMGKALGRPVDVPFRADPSASGQGA